MTPYFCRWPMPDDIWQAAAEWLRPAMADTKESDVVAELAKGTAQLWVAERDGAIKAALVTQCGEGDDTLHLWLCGGDGGDWSEMLNSIMEQVLPHGVLYWSMHKERKGWARALRGVKYGRR